MHGPSGATVRTRWSRDGRRWPTDRGAEPPRAVRPQRLLAGDQHPVGRDRDQPPARADGRNLVCGGDKLCPNPTSILPGVTVGKGAAEAIIINPGVIIAILVQPTVAALSDHTSSRLGRRKPYIIVGTLLDIAFLLGFYLAGAWVGTFIFYCLLQFSSNFAQWPFQGYMPDLVPAKQVGLASGLMGLMIRSASAAERCWWPSPTPSATLVLSSSRSWPSSSRRCS